MDTRLASTLRVPGDSASRAVVASIARAPDATLAEASVRPPFSASRAPVIQSAVAIA
jgi:hypothetical protein